MRLVKRVDVAWNEDGNMIFTENKDGNLPIYHGHVGESNAGTATKFAELLTQVFPDWLKVDTYGEIIEVENKLTNTEIKFNLKIDDKGITGYIGSLHRGWRDNYYQIFFYPFKSMLNSGAFIEKINHLSLSQFENRKVANMLKNMLPNRKVSFQWMLENDRGYCFLIDGLEYQVVKISDRMITVLSRIVEDADGRDRYDTIEAIDQEMEILRKRRLTLQGIQKELGDQFYMVKPPIATIEEKTEKELADKLRRKTDAERARKLSRIPALELQPTRQLLYHLDQSRKSYNPIEIDGIVYEPEQLKQELAHRPHQPRGKAGRQEAARLRKYGK